MHWQAIGRDFAARQGTVSPRRTRRPSTGPRGKTSAGRRLCRVPATAAPSLRKAACSSPVRKTRERSETSAALIAGQVKEFGCGRSGFPRWNRRADRTPTARPLPSPTARAWLFGTVRPVSFAATSPAKSFGRGIWSVPRPSSPASPTARSSSAPTRAFTASRRTDFFEREMTLNIRNSRREVSWG